MLIAEPAKPNELFIARFLTDSLLDYNSRILSYFTREFLYFRRLANIRNNTGFGFYPA